MSDTTASPDDSAERPAELPSSVSCVRCLTNLGGVRLDEACPNCGLLTVLSVPPPIRGNVLRKEGLRHAPNGLLCQRCGHSLGGLTLKEVCPECELGVCTSIEGGGWRPALTDDGAVLSDISCARCGYNLRSLRESGNCPECGLPIRRTIVGDFICYADPAWARRVARGAALISHFIRLLIILFVLVIVLSLLADLLRFNKRDLLAWLIAVSLPLVIGLGCVGLLLLTAAEHTWKSSDRSARWRRASRLGLIGGIASTVVARVMAGTPGAVSGFQIGVIVLLFVLHTVGVLGYFAYLGMLCDRIPDARLSHVSSALRVGFGYSMVAMTVCLMIPMLMAVVGVTRPWGIAGPIRAFAGFVAFVAGVSYFGSALRAIFFHSRLAAALAHEADLAAKNRHSQDSTGPVGK